MIRSVLRRFDFTIYFNRKYWSPYVLILTIVHQRASNRHGHTFGNNSQMLRRLLMHSGNNKLYHSYG